MSGYLHTTLETVGRNDAQIKLSSKVNNVHKHTSFKIRLGESRSIAMPDELFEEQERYTKEGYEIGSNFYKGKESGNDEAAISDNVEGEYTDSSDVEEPEAGYNQDDKTYEQSQSDVTSEGSTSLSDTFQSFATANTLHGFLEDILRLALDVKSAKQIEEIYDYCIEGEATKKEDRVVELTLYALDLEDEDCAVFLESHVF